MLTGFWHGANYTFIFWGLIQGLFLIINHVTSKPRKRFLKRMHIGADNVFLAIIDTLLTFILVMFSWVFFRADNVNQAFGIISEILSMSSIGLPEINPTSTLIFCALFMIFEWLGRNQEYAIAKFGVKWPRPLRWALYSTIILTIIWFSGVEQQFIYFKF
jgi:D-alanyl-lipoteichoic acid acyltransferase DltB (MBOAT superfamily)